MVFKASFSSKSNIQHQIISDLSDKENLKSDKYRFRKLWVSSDL